MCHSHHCGCNSGRHHHEEPPYSKEKHGHCGGRGHRDHHHCNRASRSQRGHPGSHCHWHSHERHGPHHDHCSGRHRGNHGHHDHHDADSSGGHHHHGHRRGEGTGNRQAASECCHDEDTHGNDGRHERERHVSDETRVAQLRAEREALRDEIEWIDERLADLETETGETDSEDE